MQIEREILSLPNKLLWLLEMIAHNNTIKNNGYT